MKKDSALWAACRIHRILSCAHVQSKASSVPSLSNLVAEQRLLEQCWRMLTKAQEQGWTHCVEILQRRLDAHRAQVHEGSRSIRPARVTEVSAITEILKEIRQLENEFDLTMVFPRERYLSVTTDEVTLEGIALGAFTVRLDLDRLARRRDVTAFAIIAENVNPATGDSACTHPHVRDECLCAGEATAPIAHALAEGRLGDAFQLVNRVLHTYNGASAFARLEDWDGRACGDCGHVTPGESLYYCPSCHSDYCEDCVRTCDRCDESVCCGCAEQNDAADRLCPKCKTLDDNEREEADEEATDKEEEKDEEATPLSDHSIHDPAQEEPQPSTTTIHPSTETIHELSPSYSLQTGPTTLQLPGGPSEGDRPTVTVAFPGPRAA